MEFEYIAMGCYLLNPYVSFPIRYRIIMINSEFSEAEN